MKCVQCGADFTPASKVQTLCSPECKRARQKDICRIWYAANKARHVRGVARAARQRKWLRMAEARCGAKVDAWISGAITWSILPGELELWKLFGRPTRSKAGGLVLVLPKR